MPPNRGRWPWFPAWIGVGVLGVFAILSSFGMLVLPFAIAAFFAVWNRAHGVDRSHAGPPAWPWLVLGVWLVSGILPLASVTAQVHIPLHPQHRLEVDHSISLLFGGGGSFGQVGSGPFSTVQRRAMRQAWELHSTAAEVLFLLAGGAFIGALIWRRRGDISLAVGSLVYVVALALASWSIERSVDALRAPLGGRIQLHYEIWFWVLLVVSASLGPISAVHAWRSQRPADHDLAKSELSRT